MLTDTLSRFLSDNYSIDRRHEIAGSPDGFSREIWGQMAELGIVGALFTEEAGGFAGSGDDIALVFEQLGRALVTEPFLPILLSGHLIYRLGDKDWHKKMLEQIIEGSMLTAFAHGEPSSRYDLHHVQVKAERNAHGEWELSGNKSVVLGGGSADWLVISARTGGNPSDVDGISVFMVDPMAGGISRREYGTVDGYAAAEISLENAKGELLGEEGRGYPVIEETIALGNLAVSAESLGAMEVAKDLTVEYMHTRKQFGVPIGKFQALQHRMADVLIELEQMRSAVINAAAHLRSDRMEREKWVASAKYLAGKIGRQVAEEAIQIHGGMGMTWEYPVGHYAKRIVMMDHLFGDTDHHLERYIAFAQN